VLTVFNVVFQATDTFLSNAALAFAFNCHSNVVTLSTLRLCKLESHPTVISSLNVASLSNVFVPLNVAEASGFTVNDSVIFSFFTSESSITALSILAIAVFSVSTFAVVILAVSIIELVTSSEVIVAFSIVDSVTVSFSITAVVILPVSTFQVVMFAVSIVEVVTVSSVIVASSILADSTVNVATVPSSICTFSNSALDAVRVQFSTFKSPDTVIGPCKVPSVKLT
jgi:hypothetical protein